MLQSALIPTEEKLVAKIERLVLKQSEWDLKAHQEFTIQNTNSFKLGKTTFTQLQQNRVNSLEWLTTPRNKFLNIIGWYGDHVPVSKTYLESRPCTNFNFQPKLSPAKSTQSRYNELLKNIKNMKTKEQLEKQLNTLQQKNKQRKQHKLKTDDLKIEKDKIQSKIDKIDTRNCELMANNQCYVEYESRSTTNDLIFQPKETPLTEQIKEMKRKIKLYDNKIKRLPDYIKYKNEKEKLNNQLDKTLQTIENNNQIINHLQNKKQDLKNEVETLKHDKKYQRMIIADKIRDIKDNLYNKYQDKVEAYKRKTDEIISRNYNNLKHNKNKVYSRIYENNRINKQKYERCNNIKEHYKKAFDSLANDYSKLTGRSKNQAYQQHMYNSQSNNNKQNDTFFSIKTNDLAH
jgi:chromosome segregation ATPase